MGLTMFTDEAIERFVASLMGEQARPDRSAVWRAAVDEAHTFFARVRDDRAVNPYDPAGPREYGKYVLVRTTRNLPADEWTNVGVLMYREAGALVWSKMGPYDRAVARGDMGRVPDAALDNYPREVPDMAAVMRRLGSDGHAMSSAQMTPPRVAQIDLENCWHTYAQMVLGVRH